MLKNTIDWLSRIDQKFLAEKPVLLVSTSPGANGGKSHLELLENLIPHWGGQLMGQYSMPNFFQNFDLETMRITNQTENDKFNNAVASLIKQEPLKKKNIESVVHEYFTAFQIGDTDGVINAFHPDCYIVSVTEEEREIEQLHGIYRTRKEARQFVKNIHSLFNTKDFTIDKVIPVNENLVISNGRFSHEVKATGKLFNSNWVQYCLIEDDKIKEYRFYEDSAAYTTAATL